MLFDVNKRAICSNSYNDINAHIILVICGLKMLKSTSAKFVSILDKGVYWQLRSDITKQGAKVCIKLIIKGPETI